MFDAKRHKSVFDPDEFHFPVHVIGCGGMGSRIAEGLARMGVGMAGKSPITLYDYDTFEPHNLSNQWVSSPLLSCKKVESVALQMLDINPDIKIDIVDSRVESAEDLSGVVFICIDSMEGRRTILDSLTNSCEDICCIIETRMDAAVGISHCFDPNCENQFACWRMYWYSDKEAQNMAGCGGPQSIISAIYGTTAIALKQFERFAQMGNCANMQNRVYYDMVEHEIHSERWPSS